MSLLDFLPLDFFLDFFDFFLSSEEDDEDEEDEDSERPSSMAKGSAPSAPRPREALGFFFKFPVILDSRQSVRFSVCDVLTSLTRNVLPNTGCSLTSHGSDLVSIALPSKPFAVQAPKGMKVPPSMYASSWTSACENISKCSTHSSPPISAMSR